MTQVSEQPTVINYLSPGSLEEHSESHRIPEMSPEEWTDFIESVRSRGVITDPIFALPDGRIFDGRHRHRAAVELSLRIVPVIIWEITEDEALRRMSESAVLRRSLLPGQRAAIMLEFTELVEELREKARERRGERTDLMPELAKGSAPPLHIALAEKAGIGKSSMQYLIAVQRDEPDLFAQVKAGEITINKAYGELKKRKQLESVAELPAKGKSREAAQRLEEIDRRLKAAEELAPQADPSESLTSPNNTVIRARKLMFDAEVHAVSSIQTVDRADDKVRESYMQQLQHVVESSLIIMDAYEESPELSDILSLLIEGVRRYKQLKGGE